MFDEVIGTSTIGTPPLKIGEGTDPRDEIEGSREQFRRRDGSVPSNTCLLGLISFPEPFQRYFPAPRKMQCLRGFTEQKHSGSVHKKGQGICCLLVNHLLLIRKIVTVIERNDVKSGILSYA